jgi:hypothetical protein
MEDKPTFIEWVKANKEVLTAEFEELKEIHRADGVSAGRFNTFAKQSYIFLYGD